MFLSLVMFIQSLYIPIFFDVLLLTVYFKTYLSESLWCVLETINLFSDPNCFMRVIFSLLTHWILSSITMSEALTEHQMPNTLERYWLTLSLFWDSFIGICIKIQEILPQLSKQIERLEPLFLFLWVPI